ITDDARLARGGGCSAAPGLRDARRLGAARGERGEVLPYLVPGDRLERRELEREVLVRREQDPREQRARAYLMLAELGRDVDPGVLHELEEQVAEHRLPRVAATELAGIALERGADRGAIDAKVIEHDRDV